MGRPPVLRPQLRRDSLGGTPGTGRELVVNLVSSTTTRRKARPPESLVLLGGFVVFLSGLVAWFAHASWFYIPILLGLVIGQFGLVIRMFRR